MVYGLFRALLGDRALLPPSLADRSANLTPASGRQDHTALPSAASALRLCAPPTSIASCTNVRDDREAPLFSGQDAGISAVDLPDSTSEIFFARGLDSEVVKQPVGQISSVIRRIFQQRDGLSYRVRCSEQSIAIFGERLRLMSVSAQQILRKLYSITSSARPSKLAGTDIPSTLAVLALMANS